MQFDEVADKDDLMGVEENSKRGFFSGRPSLKNRSTIFTLGNRGDVLTKDLEAPIIVPHAAQDSKSKVCSYRVIINIRFSCSEDF